MEQFRSSESCETEEIEKKKSEKTGEWFERKSREVERKSFERIGLLEVVKRFKVSEELAGGFMGTYATEVYYFKVHCAEITLPGDYLTAVTGVCSIFAEKLLKCACEDIAKLHKKINSFVKAVRQIIYNFSVNCSDLFQILQESLIKHNVGVVDKIQKVLNRFLDYTTIMMKMPKTTKKLIFITVNLNTQRQLFIDHILQNREITQLDFLKTFNSYFSCFYKDPTKDLKNLIFTCFQEFNSEIENLKLSIKQEIVSSILSYITNSKYQRVGIYALKLTANREMHPGPWVLILSLTLQSEKIALERPINITARELLIPLLMRSGSYLLYYSQTCSSRILKKFETSSLIIAPGSSPNGVLILDSQLQTNFFYSLNLSYLFLKFELNLHLKFNETITSIVLIENNKKIVFIVNQETLYSQYLDSQHKVKNEVQIENEKLLSLFYSKEFEFICLKTQKNLMIFTVHLQLLQKVEVEGMDVIGVKEGEKGCCWVMDKEKISEVLFCIESQMNKQSFLLIELEKCIYSMSKDFLNEMKGGSKYTKFLMGPFKVPVFEINGKKYLNGNCEGSEPVPVEIHLWNEDGKDIRASFKCDLLGKSLSVVPEFLDEDEEELENKIFHSRDGSDAGNFQVCKKLSGRISIVNPVSKSGGMEFYNYVEESSDFFVITSKRTKSLCWQNDWIGKESMKEGSLMREKGLNDSVSLESPQLVVNSSNGEKSLNLECCELSLISSRICNNSSKHCSSSGSESDYEDFSSSSS